MRARSWRYQCVLMLLVAALSGCDEGYYGPSDDPVPPKPVPIPELGLKSEIHAGGNPDQYSVVLTWRGSYQPGSWIVRRADQKGSPKVLEALVPGSARFEDKTPTSGQSYRYQLGTAGRDGFVPLGEVALAMPKDLVVRGRMPLSESARYARIFMLENSVLETRGAAVTLDVEEILSQWGTIETFPEGQKAASRMNGRTPGAVIIRAKRGTGRLRILARGEAGGDGIDGRAGQKGATGTAGGAGDWGMNPQLYKVFFPSFIDSFERAMRRSPKPPGDPEWNYTLGNLRRFVCARPPTNGGQGANGTNGGDGGDGGTGGNSPRVLVEIAEGDILVTVHPEAGKSGLGGRPGKAGEGGDGGAPGALDQGHLCQAARAGNRGAFGLDGHAGRPGESGKVSPYCIRSKGQSGDCETFNGIKP